VAFDELIDALRTLDGHPVSVSSHAGTADSRPVLHIQGTLHRDDVDDTPDWFRFVVGNVPYPDEPLMRSKLKVFEHAYFDLERPKFESAEWRDPEDGGTQFVAIAIRGGSMLRIWPHR
jgi:hypothetical protein